MKIEFFDKETGEKKYFQDHFLLSADSVVYRIVERGCGEYIEEEPTIGWRIVED